uniref:Peptidase M10 metallopeptidase domain-containing protein n=1 Tax=Solibacter usitatus (strain Ellin6076) TaxID=234267 RepID=Q01Z64_SOLUE
MKIGICVLAMTALAGTIPGAEVQYWIAPCANSAETGCKSGDAELAQWAMEAWQAASEGKLKVSRISDKERAAIRIYWATGRDGLYGETRGGDVYVRPDPGQGLTREAVTYLTCVHETGHALGLAHTANFDDIMYNFQYGGDISEYFGRYVRKLERREDIRRYSGISPNDRKRLAAGL